MSGFFCVCVWTHTYTTADPHTFSYATVKTFGFVQHFFFFCTDRQLLYRLPKAIGIKHERVERVATCHHMNIKTSVSEHCYLNPTLELIH